MAPKQTKQKPKPVQPSAFHDQLCSDTLNRLAPEASDLKPADLQRFLHYTASWSYGTPSTLSCGISNEVSSISSTCIGSRSSEEYAEGRAGIREVRFPKSYDASGASGYGYKLDHFMSLQALNSLVSQYGRISQMGMLDPQFALFMTKNRKAAVYYKIQNKVAVVGGNPLCGPTQWAELFQEFAVFRKKHGLGIAYLGATDHFAEFAKIQKGWVSMRFGTERALNPVTNKTLIGGGNKRMVKQCRQLLDPGRGNMKLHIYLPQDRPDADLEAQLTSVYDKWRAHRNTSGKPQAYMTIFDPFALPHLMLYIYTTDPEGRPNGFAALRRVENGYHIDPYCATPDAPNGTTDLLIYAALAILRRAGISYLGLGFEPSHEVTEICGLRSPMAKILESAYRKTCSRLPFAGKKAFHDKWQPDEEYDQGLYIVYPDGRPDLNHSLATMHFANVFARDVMKAEWKDQIVKLDNNLRRGKPSNEDRPSDGKAMAVPMLYNVQSGILSTTTVPMRVGIQLK